MGSAAGAAKAAARRLGVEPDEYLRRHAAGERWCGYCRAWHPAELFPTGAGQCRASRAERQRQRYTPKERPTAAPQQSFMRNHAEVGGWVMERRGAVLIRGNKVVQEFTDEQIADKDDEAWN